MVLPEILDNFFPVLHQGDKSLSQVIDFKKRGCVTVVDIARELLADAEAGLVKDILVVTHDGVNRVTLGYSSISDERLCYLKSCLDEHVTHRLSDAI